MDTTDRSRLLAAEKTVDEIAQYLDVNSLAYLSLEGLLAAAGGGQTEGFCTACLSGEYPTPVPVEIGKFVLETPA